MASKTGLILAGAAAAAFIALGGCASQQSGTSHPTPHLAGHSSAHSCKGMKSSCKGMKNSCKGK